jgi:hypothetical protein
MLSKRYFNPDGKRREWGIFSHVIFKSLVDKLEDDVELFLLSFIFDIVNTLYEEQLRNDARMLKLL